MKGFLNSSFSDCDSFINTTYHCYTCNFYQLFSIKNIQIPEQCSDYSIQVTAITNIPDTSNVFDSVNSKFLDYTYSFGQFYEGRMGIIYNIGYNIGKCVLCTRH